MRLMFWTGFGVFALDQVIKFYVLFSVFGLSWAQVRVPSDQLPYPPTVEVFPPYLVLRMAWNRGINFGSVSYTHLTLPTMLAQCRSRWSPDH